MIYKTLIKGKEFVFDEDYLLLNGFKIKYSELSEIALDQERQILQFTYTGKKIGLPYNEAENDYFAYFTECMKRESSLESIAVIKEEIMETEPESKEPEIKEETAEKVVSTSDEIDIPLDEPIELINEDDSPYSFDIDPSDSSQNEEAIPYDSEEKSPISFDDDISIDDEIGESIPKSKKNKKSKEKPAKDKKNKKAALTKVLLVFLIILLVVGGVGIAMLAFL